MSEHPVESCCDCGGAQMACLCGLDLDRALANLREAEAGGVVSLEVWAEEMSDG